MTEFGKILREAREAKGLSTAQIADQTHLLPQIVEDLEREDFHRISAPIYGRGFVKLYCEAVGLEPKPLVDEFMAILNGEREPAIRLREVELPPPAPAPAEAPPPAEPTKPVIIQPDFDSTVPTPDPAPVSTPIVTPTVAPSPSPAPAAAPFAAPIAAPIADRMDEPEDRQYHPDYKISQTFGPSLNFGRLAVVAGGAILILILLVLGAKALYRATMTVPGEETQPAVAETQEKTEEDVRAEVKEKAKEEGKTKAKAKTTDEAKTTDSAKSKRTPKDVPPLYID